MKIITIKPSIDGQYQAFTRLAVSGPMPVSKPFLPVFIPKERQHWEELEFKVVVTDNKFAKVE